MIQLTGSGDLRQGLRLARSYCRGSLTKTEFLYSLFDHLTPENVAEFVREVDRQDPGWLDWIKDLVALGDTLYAEWAPRIGTVHYPILNLPEQTEQENEQRAEQELRQRWERLRRGVEALRAFYRATDPDFPG